MNRNFSKYIKNILNSDKILEEQTEVMREYSKKLAADGVKVNTRYAYLRVLKYLAKFVKKPFKEITKEDITNYMASISDLEPSTRVRYGGTIKSFYKWLEGDGEEFPEKVDWVKTTVSSSNNKLPEDLLDKKEVREIIKAATNPRDRAIISTLYESACRPGEIVNLKIKHISFDKYGAKITVKGKTGMRRLRLVESVPYLELWLNHHPNRDNSESPLFPAFWNNKGSYRNSGIGRDGIYFIVKKLSKRAKVKTYKEDGELKTNVTPYLFRHSRLTELAKDLSESELKILAGWTPNSGMAKTYIHLSGEDVERKILERYGIKEEETEGEGEGKALEPRECPRCGEENPATAKFCYNCGMALDSKTAMEVDERKKDQTKASIALTKVLMKLLKDKRVKSILKDKSEDLGITDIKDDKLTLELPVEGVSSAHNIGGEMIKEQGDNRGDNHS